MKMLTIDKTPESCSTPKGSADFNYSFWTTSADKKLEKKIPVTLHFICQKKKNIM